MICALVHGTEMVSHRLWVSSLKVAHRTEENDRAVTAVGIGGCWETVLLLGLELLEINVFGLDLDWRRTSRTEARAADLVSFHTSRRCKFQHTARALDPLVVLLLMCMHLSCIRALERALSTLDQWMGGHHVSS